MDVDYVVLSWKESARRDWVAARHAFQTRDYPHSLFWGHLYVEKLLKALVVYRSGKHAPPTHNLTKLAEAAQLEMTPDLEKFLVEVTTFNVETRYGEQKAASYKKYTRAYCRKWLEEIDKVGKWLASLFK